MDTKTRDFQLTLDAAVNDAINAGVHENDIAYVLNDKLQAILSAHHDALLKSRA